jgi:hypothetical protein
MFVLSFAASGVQLIGNCCRPRPCEGGRGADSLPLARDFCPEFWDLRSQNRTEDRELLHAPAQCYKGRVSSERQACKKSLDGKEGCLANFAERRHVTRRLAHLSTLLFQLHDTFARYEHVDRVRTWPEREGGLTWLFAPG